MHMHLCLLNHCIAHTMYMNFHHCIAIVYLSNKTEKSEYGICVSKHLKELFKEQLNQ